MSVSGSRLILREALSATRKASTFSLIPAVAILVPLVVLPIVSRRFGADGLVAVAVGQSVGSVVGLAVGLSYPLTGSNFIAREGAEVRVRYYVRSIETRLLVFLFTAPFGAIAATLLVDTYTDVSLLGALANSALGFTAFWYYSGTGRPRGLLLYEVIPRVAASAIAIPALLLGLPLFLYPALLLLAALFGVVANLGSVQGSLRIHLGGRTFSEVKAQFGATLSRILNGLYFVGATSLVALVTPAPATLLFSSADRVQKSAFNGAIIFPQALVSWVARLDTALYRRQKIVLVLDLAFCCLAGVFLWLIFPVLVRFMFQGVVHADMWLRSAVCLALAAALYSKCVLFHGMLPSRMEVQSSRLLSCGSAVGAVAVCGGAYFWGAIGGASGILLTEMGLISVGLTLFVWNSRSKAGCGAGGVKLVALRPRP